MKRGAVALIDEPRCIGCTRCIDACPVDAISGARGLMHAVIAPWCTGCELCLPACPVDCIDMVSRPARWTQADARDAKRRAALRKQRISAQLPRSTSSDRQAVIAAALKRRQAR
ncbi:MAG: RnfABCDGE type electron transport complex subunit B [Betaproteobacteria bacterium]|nr:RnfABCDGE type electron transport complex subunit B [Betaproteobacteria bacterium]